MKTRVRARITGRVQGVGFRPTVYRYATQFGLAGFVCNDAQGVTVEVEGDDWQIAAFFKELEGHPPPQAVIADMRKQVCAELGAQQFEVVASDAHGEATAHISPDLALCDDCRRELREGGDRRRRHPFINCTNCGPRFTIVRALPYDRASTSMAGFAMCEHCEHEYHNPGDRRFHAQPTACRHCGPQLEWRTPTGVVATREPLGAAANLLRRGGIVALKSLGGYHLACDATHPEAVARLRERKRRPHKPFAVMFRDSDTLRRYCHVSEIEEAELLSIPRPIVIVSRRRGATGLADNLAPDTTTVGAFLPFTPLHELLMQDFDALVMTSSNHANEPIASDEAELVALLGPVADAALTHNRAIIHKCDDSVVRVLHGHRQFFRRARGFVPNPIRVAARSPQVLAVGGELKNTFCLVRDGQAFVSQHIGDLKDFKTFEYLDGEISSWRKLMGIEPAVVAYDLHPAYLSTRYALEADAALAIGVQHHHAHIVSVMAEHDLRDPVIGVALDGTGYGIDGTIWGGEFMIADRIGFERVAHFKVYPLPGGDRAVEEPWRMAVSVLHSEGLDHAARAIAGAHQLGTIRRMIDAGFNAPVTSSAGRLFDAVAGILGLCDRASYEAQGAIRLEAVADPRVVESYPYAVDMREGMWTIDFGPAIRAIVQEQLAGIAVAEIAAKFHNTVAEAIVQRCKFLRAWRGINTVALSGGVFQNALLLTRAMTGLRHAGFDVFTNVAVPPNDGGLSLGQAAVAVARLTRQREGLSQGELQPCV
jgi:hydrogenase maturation protein HypF